MSITIWEITCYIVRPLVHVKFLIKKVENVSLKYKMKLIDFEKYKKESTGFLCNTLILLISEMKSFLNFRNECFCEYPSMDKMLEMFSIMKGQKEI